MMGARDLLHDLAGAGLSVTAHGDQLVIRPASKLTDDMRAALREAKAELLALLAGDAKHSARVRARLLRWGWPAPEAEAMAERLVRRDREADDRVSCAECAHYRPGRCGKHPRAGLHSPGVARDLAAMLQRCPGFDPRITLAR